VELICDDDIIKEIECPTDGCDKVIAKAKLGRVMVWCKKCGQEVALAWEEKAE